ncbi:MAG: hypothetical protein U0270_10610 [Labilithrix sp.]
MTDHETPGSRPPAGGFGMPQSGRTGIEHRAIEPIQGMSFMHVVFIAFGGAVFSLCLFAVWGQWRKQKDLRAAEARNNVGVIAKGVAATYETTGQLCPSGRAIPADVEEVRGKTYTSRHAEWEDDPGWSCAGFAFDFPQRYQYRLETKDDLVTILAVGDHDGDDLRATYELRGRANPARHRIDFDTSIRESNPGE